MLKHSEKQLKNRFFFSPGLLIVLSPFNDTHMHSSTWCLLSGTLSFAYVKESKFYWFFSVKLCHAIINQRSLLIFMSFSKYRYKSLNEMYENFQELGIIFIRTNSLFTNMRFVMFTFLDAQIAKLIPVGSFI